MKVNPRTPCIIGVAQKTVHKPSLPGPEPLVAWRDVARMAAADANISPELLSQVNSLAVAHCMSWPYDECITRLADSLAAKPHTRYLGPPSGTSGQSLVNKCAKDIESGQTDMALLCGGESLATVKHYQRLGQTPPWSFRDLKMLANTDDFLAHQHPDEWAIGLFDGVGAVYSFALRDVARRAHLGIKPDEYRRQLGDLLSSMTTVAANNPLAWFPRERDRDFIITPRHDNRMIAYPYTKHMVANIEVDISAALIMASEQRADELGVPREQRVYPWASCYAEDAVHIGVRPKLWKSEGMEAAGKATLDAVGISMTDVKYVDIYSCFAAAVNFGRDALGISDHQGNRVTVTGGLPYAGGPASSYVFTSIVAMAHKLRGDPGAFGMITGIGMMMSNHVCALYSTKPPTASVAPIDEGRVQAQINRIPHPAIDSGYTGAATVAAYTIMYDRAGAMSHGAAICDLPSGQRAYARILDRQLLEDAERTELVGQRMQIKRGNKVGELVRTTIP